MSESVERSLATFIGRYSPNVAAVARRARIKVRKLLPGACELVYDNYNALAIAYGPTERASDVIVPIALYPRWVSLFFARGAELSDPQKLLRGSGKTIRHIVLADAAQLDAPAVLALIRSAVASHPKRLDAGASGRTIIKSTSTKQRRRRPARQAGRRTRR